MIPKPSQGRAFIPNLLGGIARTAHSIRRIRSTKRNSKIPLTVTVETKSATVDSTPETEKIEVKENQLTISLETSKCMSLPNELFSEIFILCLPYIASNPKHLQQWFPSIDYFAVDLHGVRRSLSQVCRRWRSVVHSTHAMWTSLVLGRSLKWDEEALKVNLERSGECLLDVYIRPKIWAESKSRVTTLMKIVRGHVHRLRSFMVDRIYWDELHGLFPLNAETMTALPALQTFVVRQYTPNFTTLPDSDFLLMGRVYTPILVYMELAEAVMMNSFMTISLPYLRNLNLASPKIYVLASTYYQFLASCPSLVSLCFTRTSVMAPPELESEAPEHRLMLPMLENFEFVQDHTPDTTFLVRSFQLPALKSLKFGQFEPTRRDPGFIHQFFSQIMVESTDTLEILHLLQGAIPVDDTFYSPLIKTMRNLKSLIFDNILLQDSIIDALMPNTEDLPEMWPCPKLRSLTFNQLDIDGDGLVELFKVRTLSNEAVTARTKTGREAAREQKTTTEEKLVHVQTPIEDQDTSAKDQEVLKGQEPLMEQEPTKDQEPANNQDAANEQEAKSKNEEISANGLKSVTSQESLTAEESTKKQSEEKSPEEEPPEEESPAKDETSVSDDKESVNDKASVSSKASISSMSTRRSFIPYDCGDGYFNNIMINRCSISSEAIYKSFIDLSRAHANAVKFYY